MNNLIIASTVWLLPIIAMFGVGQSAAQQIDNVTPSPELSFSIRQGNVYNQFLRQDKVAAHTVLTSGTKPRLVVAFPAGNSGVGLWFKAQDGAMLWQDIEHVRPLHGKTPDGDALYGISARLVANTATLSVEQAVLGNVRILRNYMHSTRLPHSIVNETAVTGDSVTWYRDRLDGQAGYRLTVKVVQGYISGGGDNNPIVFHATNHLPLQLQIEALTGDKPLTPITIDQLFNDKYAAGPTKTQQILAFLSYQQKLLAGSWRFATYFGRDTLMTVRLLMPVLKPAVIEAALGSVIERLNPQGEVAHEEDLAEFAMMRHLSAGHDIGTGALYDYKMIDDDYMLAPITAHYLLDKHTTHDMAKQFLRRQTRDGTRYGVRLVENFNFVLASAKAYANKPKVGNLLRLRAKHSTGQWRDSGEGLGFGKIPYDVNAVLVPAALRAIAQLLDSGLLAEYIDNSTHLMMAQPFADVWRTHAPQHFRVTLPVAQAKKRLAEYATNIGVDAKAALASLMQPSIGFNALALDAQGSPIAVMHSDDGFGLLFSDPDDSALLQAAQSIIRPFPAGLLTPVGMVVANPVYTSNALQQVFSNNHYHGTVIWSWQQALFAAGLKRQLKRDDISASTRGLLLLAQTKLWQAISAAQEFNNAELWSWSFADGDYHIEPFGQQKGDKTESNAAQLWSTVYLAIERPKSVSIRAGNKVQQK